MDIEVTSDADGSAGKEGVENVHEGGQRATSDLACCIHYALQSSCRKVVQLPYQTVM